MRLFRKGYLLLWACAVLVTSHAFAGKGAKDAAPAKSGASPKGDEKASAAVDSADATAARVAIPLVEGHDSFGLKIPYFANGRRQMNYNIGVASRLDPDHVKMKDLQVQTFDDSGDPEMTIEMPESVMNLSSHVITSDTKTVINRPDMKITGDSVVFNTLTKQGQMVGSVHMTIFNIKSVADPGEEKPAAPPAPASPAAAPATPSSK